MKVTNKQEAWNKVNKIFPTDYEQDLGSSDRAGYPIYRSTAEGHYYDYICDLGNRLEVNLDSSHLATVNIWIEEPAKAEDNVQAGVEAMHAAKAARAPRGQSIEKRPEEVKSLGSFGHWEMDSVMGCKGSKQALLVLTERRTRMGIVLLVEDHTAASVVKAINGLERRFGKLFYKLFKSITIDNGCEFQDFEGIEMSHRRKGKRTVVFFCHPYSAFERGSNENMNRLIRRFFPKGTNFDNVTREEVMAAERWVNNYPRKILGWKSAAMLFDQELQAA